MWRKSPPPVRPIQSGLFDRAKEGDTAALAILADWFYTTTPRVYAHRIAARYGLESGELLNEAVLALLYGANKATFESTERLVRYVYRVCVNRANRFIRECRGWSHVASDPLETVPSRVDGPSDRMESSEAMEAVLEALNALPVEDGEVVRMFYLHGHKIAEIATHMGKPEGTVKRMLHDARVSLRTTLECKL